MQLISSVDRRARDKAVSVMVEKFRELVKQIIKGESPTIILPKRTLSNTIYDEERKLLLLGPETLSRTFLDIREAKKFMQTVVMARIIYESLINNEYPTIRDLFYRGKHTIRYRTASNKIENENTWDEQKESDGIIRDIEVFINLLREELLILSKEKGKIVGNMRIRSGDDVIDLSKMGHGAYSIEPTPDLIEFLDVDAEYVLIVEKDAVFQQLHRAGFWRKYKTLLITSAGQPDRATRRFVRRLSDELNLPTYIITDSIPADEVVIIKDPKNDIVRVGPVEELIGHYFSNSEKERIFIDLEVPAWDPISGNIEWRKIGYAYRHWINDKVLSIRTNNRGTVKVTGGHSLFVLRDGVIAVLPARSLRPGDHILVASNLPPILRTSTAIEKIPTLAVAPNFLTNQDVDDGEYLTESVSKLAIEVSSYNKQALDRKTYLQYSDVSTSSSASNVLRGDYVNLYKYDEGAVDFLKKIFENYGCLSYEDGVPVLIVEDRVRAKQIFNILLSLSILPYGVDEYKDLIKISLPSIKRLNLTEIPSTHVTFAEVIDILEEDYTGYVYDFMVPECNSFIGSYGVIYHNSDPYGWYIYSVFKIGSITLSYESERLATPGLRFLGVMPSDIFGSPNIKKSPYLSESERRNYIIKAKDRDIKRAKELINYRWFQTPRWKNEIDIFMNKGAKLEIEALTSKGLKFLMDEYIPKKLEVRDWID